MIPLASDFIHLGENAETISFNGSDVVARWTQPHMRGSHGELYEAVVIHVAATVSDDPSNAIIIRSEPNRGVFKVESKRKVLEGALWKLVLSNDD